VISRTTSTGPVPLKPRLWNAVNETVPLEQCRPYGRKIGSLPHQFSAQLGKMVRPLCRHYRPRCSAFSASTLLCLSATT
jgi:hypothetical protein